MFSSFNIKKIPEIITTNTKNINTDKIAVTVTEKKWRNRCDKIGSKNSVNSVNSVNTI